MDGGQGVLVRILRIIEKLHIIFVYQIFKLFLQVTHRYGDVRNPCLMKLAYLALNHTLPEHLQKPLGGLKCQGDEPGAKPCCYD